METTETTTLAKSNQGEQQLSRQAVITAQSLQLIVEQRQLLKKFVESQMIEGVDYGKIPGTDKPSLLKPGAEKLVDLFRCTPKFTLLTREEDFDKGFFNYMFRVRLYQRDADAVVAEGFGSANSREGRYRWRNGERKCPNCGKAAIIKGKAEYGGGWVCFNKKGGCGAKWKDGDAAIEGQVVGKVENDDIATLANTILKMAKKRAQVDAAIALGRCSDMFTQDVEDLPHDEHAPNDHHAAAPDRRPEPQPAQASAQPKPEPKTEKQPAKMATVDARPGESVDDAVKRAKPPPKRSAADLQDQVQHARAARIWGRAKEAAVTKEEFANWCGATLGPSAKEWKAMTREDLDILEACLPDLLRSKQPHQGNAPTPLDGAH